MERAFRVVPAFVSIALVVTHGVLSASAGLRHHAGGEQPATVLEAGQRIQRELTAADAHTYRTSLLTDQYVELRIEQQGIAISVQVSNPDGSELLATSNATGPRETRVLRFITTASGDYSVAMTPATRLAAAGTYAVTLAAPRTPSAEQRRTEESRLLLARAETFIQQGKYDAAMEPARQALELSELLVGPDGAQVADALHVLAKIHDDKGNYAEAEPVNLRALAIREKVFGADHQDVAKSLFNLGWIYQTRQDYAKAEATYQRALAIQERVFGPSHREVAATLNDLAILYHKKGEYEKAIEIDVKVLAVRERLFGSSDAAVALTLNNLGLDYIQIGDYARAEPSFLRAMQIYEETRGSNHPDLAVAANNLAIVYEYKGDYAAAERLHLRALAIDEAARGPDHQYVGKELNNLGRLYEAQKEYAKAGPMFVRALAIREKALGPTHSDVGEALNNLAHFYVVSGTGRSEEIESMLERSRNILERALGPDNAKVGAPIAVLARFYDDRDRLDRAEPLYQRSLAIQQTALGPEHPSVAALVGRLAALYEKRGDLPRALDYWTRYEETRERIIEHNVPLGSERQKLGYLSLFADDVDQLLSFHAQSAPDNPAALKLAVTTVLQRKGRGLDAAADTIGVLRAHAEAEPRALFSELAEARTRLASLTLAGPERGDALTYRSRLEQASATVERIEANVSARSAVFRSDSRPVTLEAVQRAMPPDSALIEFARYRRKGDRSAPAASAYSAYLVFANGRMDWVDLGEATSLDRRLDEWRRSLRDPHRDDVRALARAVDDRLMRPLRARLGQTRRLLVSPDGPLHLIPFAALVDEQQRYLVDRYAITYLTSGRDLLRLQVPRQSRSRAVVVADPEFGAPARVASNGASPPSGAGVDYSQVFFGPLPGVRAEVEALRTLLPQATFLTKERATKAALADVAGPRILHIATHGFFLADASAASDKDDPSTASEGTRLAKIFTEDVGNPLLRSGLALAGANAGGGGTSAGVLTALEAAGLDLWGTELVVLSACDTGVGEVKNGDGVYGLRRALVLAGSESQMISLWPISDSGTRELVVDYYSELSHGVGRGDALRRVQQKMRRSTTRSHPYYWASFILSGQWTTLDLHP